MGANSYIGEHVRNYLLKHPGTYKVDIMDTVGLEPIPEMFSSYDVVFNVVGIAHIKETKKNRHIYYDVNHNLVVKIAKAAKLAGVSQFILLSTMSVYGLLTGYITKDTIPSPNTAYGDSKYRADEEIRQLADESFKFACLRPPMVYGENCKGNYQRLRRFALKSPIFPQYTNKRSMIYIENLCEFVKLCIDDERCGLFFPQNAEYSNTSDIVQMIAEEHGKTIKMTKVFNLLIRIIPLNIIKKVFGSLTYEKVDTVSLYEVKQSIQLTEKYS